MQLRSQHPGEDGSARLLLGLQDGQTVEAVLLPRDGLCVSSQVGCAVGCQFCMTGTGGLVRQVSSGEMVAQVALAWLLQRAEHIIPIPGTTSIAHLEDNLAASRLVLSADQAARLDAAINQRTVQGARYNSATQAEIDTEGF